MRVLHLVHQYFPEYVGGTELCTKWVVEALSERGHQVSIFYRRSAEGAGLEKRMEGGGAVWAVWSGTQNPSRRFLTTFGERTILKAFQQVVAETQPDLIHLQHLMGLPVSLVRHAQQMGVPFVITLHDYWWVCANAQLFTNYSHQICQGPKAFLNCARCALARANRPQLWPAIPGLAGLLARRNRLLRQVMQAAHKLIAPSQFVADWYATHGVPAKALQVIPHGLPLPTSPPRPQENEIRPIRFAYIGGLSTQKGVHILLEAFNELEEGAELWIAGDETADPAYVARLRQGASPSVRFLGRLRRDQVWETMTQVDVVVVPTLWYESFSLIVSEAFAVGRPVVASRLGPLAERVRHEVDGLLMPPGDVVTMRQTLRRFLREPALLLRLQAGINKVQTIGTHVNEVEGVYASALAKVRRSKSPK